MRLAHRGISRDNESTFESLTGIKEIKNNDKIGIDFDGTIPNKKWSGILRASIGETTEEEDIE